MIEQSKINLIQYHLTELENLLDTLPDEVSHNILVDETGYVICLNTGVEIKANNIKYVDLLHNNKPPVVINEGDIIKSEPLIFKEGGEFCDREKLVIGFIICAVILSAIAGYALGYK